MRMILLSGGTGKRLWPLSNDIRSKIFLKLLPTGDGGRESMLQRIWRQLNTVGLAGSAYVATRKNQLEMLHSQLDSKVPVILEPDRRDTFPAAALAAAYLYSVCGAGLSEVVCVLPVDPYVDDEFFHRIKKLENIVLTSGADLALIGVKPAYPSGEYGYIIPGVAETDGDYLKVSHFTEKPSETEAHAFIRQNAFWNCGVFAFKLGYLAGILEGRGYSFQYENLVKHYDRLPSISFDYEVVERAKSMVVLPYEGQWKDLGNWNTLTEEMDTNLIGKGVLSEDSYNTHLINELNIPVTVIGLSDVVVASSPDGILVADKAASPRVKQLMKDFEQRPMYAERRWGWYRVLDYTKFSDGSEVLTRRIGVKAGKNLSYQTHAKRSELWTVIKGEGEFSLNDKIISVKAGDVLQIPVGAKHAIRAVSDLEFIEVQIGSELTEDDTVRLCTTWEEIEKRSVQSQRFPLAEPQKKKNRRRNGL